MRDKLIELLQGMHNAVCDAAVGWLDSASYADQLNVEADYLIANGVTVEQWFPVSERLPVAEWRVFTTDMDWEVYPCLCSVKRTDGIRYATKLFFTGENFVDAEYVRYTEQVTHWMPLPEPPKEGE